MLKILLKINRILIDLQRTCARLTVLWSWSRRCGYPGLRSFEVDPGGAGIQAYGPLKLIQAVRVTRLTVLWSWSRRCGYPGLRSFEVDPGGAGIQAYGPLKLIQAVRVSSLVTALTTLIINRFKLNRYISYRWTISWASLKP